MTGVRNSSYIKGEKEDKWQIFNFPFYGYLGLTFCKATLLAKWQENGPAEADTRECSRLDSDTEDGELSRKGVSTLPQKYLQMGLKSKYKNKTSKGKYKGKSEWP